MNRSRTRKVTIPADILADLDALPSSTVVHEVMWTPEMDAVLLSTWGTKKRGDTLALFTKHYGIRAMDTLRKRAAKLEESNAK